MSEIVIRTILSEEDIKDAPKINSKVREYVWKYIYDNILLPKKIMSDNKYNYRLTLDLNKFNPEKHKFFTDSPFNTEENKFRPEPKFNTQGNLKFVSIGVVSKLINNDTAPKDYANIVYDAFGSFLILISKKVTKEELDKFKSGLDYNYINSFTYPATIEDCDFFII
jgi:hypothetical protein